MVKVGKLGLMGLSSWESIIRARNKEKENSFGQTKQCTKVSSPITTLKDMDNTHGLISVSLWVTGSTIKCMARVFSLGQMEKYIRVSTVYNI